MFGLPQFSLELREFIRRLNVTGELLRELRRRVEALEQGVRDESSRRPVICLSSFLGQVIGCNARSLASPPLLLGPTIHIVGHETATDYGLFTLSAGTVDLGLYLSPAESTLDVYVTGPGSRFATSSAYNRGFIRCSSSNFGTLQTTPASGYTRWWDAQFPIATTLSVADSRYGAGSITYDAVNGRWVGTANSNMYWFLAGDLRMFVFRGANAENFPSGWGARVDPDSGTTKFSITLTVPANTPIYTSGDTIQIYEPCHDDAGQVVRLPPPLPALLLRPGPRRPGPARRQPTSLRHRRVAEHEVRSRGRRGA